MWIRSEHLFTPVMRSLSEAVLEYEIMRPRVKSAGVAGEGSVAIDLSACDPRDEGLFQNPSVEFKGRESLANVLPTSKGIEIRGCLPEHEIIFKGPRGVVAKIHCCTPTHIDWQPEGEDDQICTAFQDLLSRFNISYERT